MYAHAVILAAAFLAIFLVGKDDTLDLGVFLAGAGLAMTFLPPARRPSGALMAVAFVFLLLGGTSLLPRAWFPPSIERDVFLLNEGFALPASITGLPVLTIYWLGLLAISCAIAIYLLSHPLGYRSMKWVVVGVVAAIGIYAVLCVVDFTTPWQYPIPRFAKFGFFPNRSHTSLLLVAGSILSCGLGFAAVRERSWWILGVSFPVLAICAYGLLYLSDARSGVLFLGLGIVLWLVGLGRPLISTRLLVSTLVIGLTVIVLFLGSSTKARNRLVGSFRPSEPAAAGKVTTDMRLRIYGDALQMVAARPLTGFGLGTFQYNFPLFEKGSITNSHAVHPESDYFMLACEAGIPALVAGLVGLGMLLVGGRGLPRTPEWILRWPLLVVGFIALLQAGIDVPVHRPPLGWLILGLALAGLQNKHRTNDRVTPWAGRLGFQAVGAVVLAAGTWHLAASARWAPQTPPTAMKFAQAEIIAEFQAENRDHALVLADRAIAKYPLHPTFYFQKAALLTYYPSREAEMERVMAAERALLPYRLEVLEQQANMWLEVDSQKVGQRLTDAVYLSNLIYPDPEGRLGTYGRLLRSAVSDPVAYGYLSKFAFGDMSYLFAYMQLAPAPLHAGLLADTQSPRGLVLLERLPAKEQREVLNLWCNWSGPEAFRQFLDEHPLWKPQGWPILGEALAQKGEYRAAVELALSSLGFSMDLNTEVKAVVIAGEWPELAELIASQNTVAVNRVMAELRSSKERSKNHRLSAVQAAQNGDWQGSWGELREYLRERK